MRNPSRPILFLSLFFAGACSSTAPAREPLPFHVAVVPINPSLQAADSEEEPLSMHLIFDGERVTEAVLTRLEEEAFTRVSLLSWPTDEPRSRFLTRSLSERQAWWVQAAQDLEPPADLILVSDFIYSPHIRREANGWFAANLPLYLFTGPLSFLVADHRYEAEVQLTASLFDLNPVYALETDLGRGSSRLATLAASFEGADLNLVDRAGSDLSTYAFSIVIPPGFLAHENEGIPTELVEQALDELGAELAACVLERAELILEPALEGNVRFGSDTRAEVDGEGRLFLRGSLEREIGLEAPIRLRLTAGGRTWEETLGGPRPGRPGSTAPMEAGFTLASATGPAGEARWVRVEVMEGRRALRSFTFPVEPRESAP